MLIIHLNVVSILTPALIFRPRLYHTQNISTHSLIKVQIYSIFALLLQSNYTKHLNSMIAVCICSLNILLQVGWGPPQWLWTDKIEDNVCNWANSHSISCSRTVKDIRQKEIQDATEVERLALDRRHEQRHHGHRQEEGEVGHLIVWNYIHILG